MVAAAGVAVAGVAAVIAVTSATPRASRSPLSAVSPVSSPLPSGGPSSSFSLVPGGGARGYQHGSVTEHGDVYPFAVYVPSIPPAGSAAPLVVVLHGCATTADQMAAATRFDVLAERDRFIVLYPDVDGVDASSYGRCWKGIWAPDLEGRGVGDAGAIADMAHGVMRRWHADPGRVYAIGISSGGYETSILGAFYPDVFAAIGVHSGAPYLGAQPGCLPAGAGMGALADDALGAMGPRARVVPVIVIHGDVDPSVPYRCGEQVIAQWLGADDVVLGHEHRRGVAGPAASVRDSAVAGMAASVRDSAVAGGHRYTVRSYVDGPGCVVAELLTVHGMGHYWSGGSADIGSARYSDPRGPSAAAAAWAFFSRWGLSGPLGGCGRGG
jgi:poly(hydroxyalkanoate) depolymerase family esterase